MFSKVPILETFQHRYALNGYPHKVFHGDWFGGKALCLCKIDFKGVKINVYSTHVSINNCVPLVESTYDGLCLSALKDSSHLYPKSKVVSLIYT